MVTRPGRRVGRAPLGFLALQWVASPKSGVSIEILSVDAALNA